MITEVLVLVLAGVLAYAILKEGRPRNYPPGPSWWPFLGNGFLVRKLSRELKGHHLAFLRLGEEHKTSVLGLKLGRELVVVALSPEAVREVHARNVFAGRPTSFFLKLRCFGRRQGITGNDGDVWAELRGFTASSLRHWGYGKQTMGSLIMNEVDELLQVLDQEKVVNSLGATIAPRVLNILWALITGKRLRKDDPRLNRLLTLLDRRSRAFDMAGGLLSQMPWLRFIAPGRTGYSLLKEINSEFREFFMETIDEERKTYDPEVTRNFIDDFLHQRTFQRGKHSQYTDDELIVLLLDLFLGGAQTTSQTLDFAVLMMIHHPDIQEKVYRNIIDVVGKDRIPTIEDRLRLPYVDAVLLEVMRISCVVPISGPRRSLADTTIDGYFIPKDTTILMNLYGVHHNENLFPKPEEFLPERFLSPDGLLKKSDNLLTFGLGKRRCLGEALAKSFIFIIFSAIIQNFEVTCSERNPSLEPLLGLTLAPKPYKPNFSPRCHQQKKKCLNQN